jgi:CheY-like chemotaxis protein
MASMRGASFTFLLLRISTYISPEWRDFCGTDIHSAINQQIAMKTIRNLKFQVSAVWNGKEALEYLLQLSNPRPDIILMDVRHPKAHLQYSPYSSSNLLQCQMPILDGYRATHLIRHHAPYCTDPSIQAIPIVAMTASAIQGDREKCEKAGMDDYLAKPVKRTILERMLVKWIDHTLKTKSPSGRRPLQRKDSCMSVDPDSDCPGSEIAMEILGVRGSRAASIARSVEQADLVAQHNAELLGTDYLPNVETENDRRIWRSELEEKATNLRNDKLLEASGTGPHGENDHAEDGMGNLNLTDQTTSASHNHLLLTVENMGKLAKEQEQHDAELSHAIKNLDVNTSPDLEISPNHPGQTFSKLSRPILHPQLPLPVPTSTASPATAPLVPGMTDPSMAPNLRTVSKTTSPNRSTVGSLSGLSPGRKKAWGPAGSAVKRNDSDWSESEMSERTAVPAFPRRPST